MTISRQTVADKIAAYLHHEITLAELVAWAEGAMMEGELAKAEMPLLSEVIARLGVADSHGFGLTWEDCEQLLRQLGYRARVEVLAA